MYRRKWIVYCILICTNMFWISNLGIAYATAIDANFSNSFKLLVVPIMWCFGIMSLIRSFEEGRLYLAATFCACISVITVAFMSLLNLSIFVGDLSMLFKLMNLILYGILIALPFILVLYKKEYMWSNRFDVEIKNILMATVVGVVSVSLYVVVM